MDIIDRAAEKYLNITPKQLQKEAIESHFTD
jgi:hypothetical protein